MLTSTDTGAKSIRVFMVYVWGKKGIKTWSEWDFVLHWSNEPKLVLYVSRTLANLDNT